MSSQEHPINAGVPQGSALSPTLFLLYINDLPNNVICNIAICADDATLYSNYSELESDLDTETLPTGARSGLLISMLETLNACFVWPV